MKRFYDLPIKTRIGIVAAALLTGALITYTAAQLKVPHAQPMAVCLRFGMALGAIWLAWDHLAAIPKMFWAMIPVVILVGAFRPYYLFVLVPALFLMMLLWPKRKREQKPPRNNRSLPPK